jgi:hypothetical protein
MQRTRTTIITFGAYSAMNRQIARGKIEMFNRHEMLDIIIVDGKARGICETVLQEKLKDILHMQLLFSLLADMEMYFPFYNAMGVT